MIHTRQTYAVDPTELRDEAVERITLNLLELFEQKPCWYPDADEALDWLVSHMTETLEKLELHWFSVLPDVYQPQGVARLNVWIRASEARGVILQPVEIKLL